MLCRKGVSPSGVKLLSVREKSLYFAGVFTWRNNCFVKRKQQFHQVEKIVSCRWNWSFMLLELLFHAGGTFIFSYWNKSFDRLKLTYSPVFAARMTAQWLTGFGSVSLSEQVDCRYTERSVFRTSIRGMNPAQSQFIGNFQPNFPVLKAGSEEQACIHSAERAVI